MDDTRGQIRAAALDLFTKQGYEPTSLREIADRVGITKASLYYHYPSKQALLLALVEPLVREWRDLAAAAVAQPPTTANRRAMVAGYLDMMIGHRPVASMLTRDAAATVPALAPLIGDLNEVFRSVQTWLAGPDPTNRDRIRAHATLETIGAALSAAGMLPDVTDAELRETLLEAALAVLPDRPD